MFMTCIANFFPSLIHDIIHAVEARIKKILEGIVRNDRVAGAYLFSGPPGAGKKEVAEHFVELLDCKKQDRVLIGPEGATLKIGQVRELQKWVRFGPSASRYLLAIVEGADTLTGEAAAAFLKTLEEPAAGVVFVLLVEREDRLPATILSRCQRIVFPEEAVSWQANQDFSSFYEELKNIKQRAMVELFGFSSKLEKEKERIEELLYELAYFARYQLSDARCARIILDSLRYLKRKANLKLTLDVMCLRLSEIGACNV
jgi:DNA polymerase III gamma/tau subunit